MNHIGWKINNLSAPIFFTKHQNNMTLQAPINFPINFYNNLLFKNERAPKYIDCFHEIQPSFQHQPFIKS